MSQFDNLPKEMFELVGADGMESEKITRPSLTYWQDAFVRFRKNKASMFGIVIICILALFAIFAPMLSERSYKDQNIRHTKLPPKIEALANIHFLPFDGRDIHGVDKYAKHNIKESYWFGTDDLGRDLWVRTWTGTRVSLYIALLAATLELFIGVTYGGISAFYGGTVDTIMQRIVEVLYGIPYLIVVILFILIFEPGIISITLGMALTGWIGMSRIVRGQILKLKSMEYVLASRTLGASNSSLIFKHLIPNTLGAIIITTMFTIPAAIFGEAFLSFIGLGMRPPLASLGVLVNDGFRALQSYPHMMFIPATVISLLILSLNLFADGLRDALDPKMRK